MIHVSVMTLTAVEPLVAAWCLYAYLGIQHMFTHVVGGDVARK